MNILFLPYVPIDRSTYEVLKKILLIWSVVDGKFLNSFYFYTLTKKNQQNNKKIITYKEKYKYTFFSICTNW